MNSAPAGVRGAPFSCKSYTKDALCSGGPGQLAL
jgi:hypothetical protein